MLCLSPLPPPPYLHPRALNRAKAKANILRQQASNHQSCLRLFSPSLFLLVLYSGNGSLGPARLPSIHPLCVRYFFSLSFLPERVLPAVRDVQEAVFVLLVLVHLGHECRWCASWWW